MNELAFSPTGRLLAVNVGKNGYGVLHLLTGEWTHWWSSKEYRVILRFGQTDDELWACDFTTAYRHNLSTLADTRFPLGGTDAAAVWFLIPAPDQESVLLSRQGSPPVFELWATPTDGEPAPQWSVADGTGFVWWADWSLDGRWVATMQGDRVTIRDAVDGSVRHEFRADYNTIRVSFLESENRFLVRSSRKVYVREAGSRKPVHAWTPDGPKVDTEGLAVHPSGRLIATTGKAAVRFWDAASFQLTKEFDWQFGKSFSVTFSRDGSLAGAGNETGKVVVWDVDL